MMMSFRKQCISFIYKDVVANCQSRRRANLHIKYAMLKWLKCIQIPYSSKKKCLHILKN